MPAKGSPDPQPRALLIGSPEQQYVLSGVGGKPDPGLIKRQVVVGIDFPRETDAERSIGRHNRGVPDPGHPLRSPVRVPPA